ncbi:MAG: hypothetical protein PHF64_10450 [Methanoregula sp.]|nr:hypothetical protein [Methanoregula sp.]
MIEFSSSYAPAAAETGTASAPAGDASAPTPVDRTVLLSILCAGGAVPVRHWRNRYVGHDRFCYRDRCRAAPAESPATHLTASQRSRSI